MNASPDDALQLVTRWGSRTILYTLEIESRRDLLIAVHPDLRVHVRAPLSRPLEHVLRRIHSRRAWIARQLAEFERMTPLPPPRFVSGETILYLGKEYQLRIEHDGRCGRGVSLNGGRLHAHVAARGGQRAIRNAIERWLRDRARDVFTRRIAKRKSEVPLLSRLTSEIRVRQMPRRWGSCSPRGVITLNPALVQAPLACVDYVLTHELVHVLEPAHSERFYRLLASAMPDWRHRRERLATAVVRWS